MSSELESNTMEKTLKVSKDLQKSVKNILSISGIPKKKILPLKANLLEILQQTRLPKAKLPKKLNFPKTRNFSAQFSKLQLLSQT